MHSSGGLLLNIIFYSIIGAKFELFFINASGEGSRDEDGMVVFYLYPQLGFEVSSKQRKGYNTKFLRMDLDETYAVEASEETRHFNRAPNPVLVLRFHHR